MFLISMGCIGPNSLLKLYLSRDATTNYVFAITFAALGSFLMRDNSPK